MNVKILILVLVVISTTAIADMVSYQGFAVFRVTPNSQKQLEYLKSLENSGVPFWKECSYSGRHCDVMLSSDLQTQLLNLLYAMGISVETLIEDLGSMVEENLLQQQGDGKIDWKSYYGLDDIYNFLDEQAANSKIASVINIGQSGEKRDLHVIKIARNAIKKPTIFVEANVHAREWITSAVATYLINELLNGEDPDVQSWTEDFDWYILPVFNVDGFAYSKSNDRMWRKNRSNNSFPLCKGVDLNRNFDYHWGGAGASNDPCSETFCGSGPNSEPETQVLIQFVQSLQEELVFYLSVHSYSQFIMFSFGDRVDESFYDSNMLIATQAAEALKVRYGTVFTPGNWRDILYVSTGTSMDWAKTNLSDPLSFTYELRDEGRYGFLLPPAQIIPSAEEFLDSLKPIINALRTGIP